MREKDAFSFSLISSPTRVFALSLDGRMSLWHGVLVTTLLIRAVASVHGDGQRRGVSCRTWETAVRRKRSLR